MQFRGKYENAWFKAGPVLGKPVSGWRYVRPVINDDKCSSCGWCYLLCPTSCVKHEVGRFVINLDFCKGCGVCAKECPVNAITMISEDIE